MICSSVSEVQANRHTETREPLVDSAGHQNHISEIGRYYRFIRRPKTYPESN